jgi:predicted GIY-YIG superfamily endonuclease
MPVRFLNVLLLEGNKFYVGYSERPVSVRFFEHFNAEGAQWTSLHPPVQVLEIHPVWIEEENELTLTMMKIYGWWNVRDG